MTARYRAFRFVVPHLLWGAEAQAVPAAGLQLTPAGRIGMVDGDESVRQAILMLIATVPGERIMRPEYGCLLYRVIFSANDDTTAGLAMHYVRSALERWEPRIDILSLDASRDQNEPGRLYIQLEYRVRASQNVQLIELPLELAAGAAA